MEMPRPGQSRVRGPGEAGEPVANGTKNTRQQADCQTPKCPGGIDVEALITRKPAWLGRPVSAGSDRRARTLRWRELRRTVEEAAVVTAPPGADIYAVSLGWPRRS